MSVKRFLTVKEFCNETRISRTTLYRHMRKGLIPYMKLGNRVLIASKLIDELESGSHAEDSYETK